jgi:hypothetical protein
MKMYSLSILKKYLFITDITEAHDWMYPGLITTILLTFGTHGSVVVTALCCKPEVAGSIPDEVIFFSVYLILAAALSSGVYSASNRN